jgi:hypothetical protein
MKKIIYLFAFVAITLVSCEKNEVVKSNHTDQIENIIAKAVALSNTHDSLVLEMLKLEQQKVLQKAKSTKSYNSKLNLNEMLEVIEQVTGVKPIILNAENADIMKIKSNTIGNSPIVNLENNFIKMSDYATSAITKKYLECIDDLLQDSEYNTYDILVSEITKVQNDIITDMNASLDDIQLVINSTEVLKGSLNIWDSVLPNNYNQANASISYVSGALNWPRWLKWVFVGAADAVGATITWYTGATLTINGVPIYLPPGPVGTAGGAAAVSALAYIIAFQ